jgi:hypothetical protein
MMSCGAPKRPKFGEIQILDQKSLIFQILLLLLQIKNHMNYHSKCRLNYERFDVWNREIFQHPIELSVHY